MQQREFFKFPRIPHVAGSRHTEDDIVLGGVPDGEFWVYEKTDGANTGISRVSPYQYAFQNRGEYIQQKRKHEQWDALINWGYFNSLRIEALMDSIEINFGEAPILFGEWLYAVHSITYDALPDHMLFFDVYAGGAMVKDWDTLSQLIEDTGLHVSPRIGRSDIVSWLKANKTRPQSQYSQEKMEGFIFRNVHNHNEVYKFVYPEFQSGITTHWYNTELRRNRLAE